MKILQFPDPMLFTKCQEVTVFGRELKKLLEEMWTAMIANNGIGLASNQIGFPYRIFTMLGPNQEKLFIVNPKILHQSSVPAELKEGCLSAKGEFIVIPDRSDIVQLMYQDENGHIHTGTFKGIHAVCVQHEIGHLNGESFMASKSLSRPVRRKLARKWSLE